MKLTSMALKTEKGKSDSCTCSAPCECDEGKPRYPWGLQVSLENEQLDALGMKEMPPVGGSLTMTCTVKVTRCSQEEREGGEPSRSLSLQITDLGLEESAQERKPIDMEATAQALYGKKEA